MAQESESSKLRGAIAANDHLQAHVPTPCLHPMINHAES